MRKLISLLLLIIIICTTMVSCTKSEDIPYICYTVDESLSARDLEFLSTSPQSFEESWHAVYGLGHMVELKKEYKEWGIEPEPFMWIQNDLENRYYLCLYTYEDAFKSLFVTIDRIFNTKLSAKYFVWYRFECDVTDIPLEMDGKILLNSFFLCDSVIKKDLMSGKNYNVNSTFYGQLGPHPANTEPYNWAYIWENMLCYRSEIVTDDLANDSKYLFITHYCRDKQSDNLGDFQLYENAEGVLYIVFDSDEGIYENGKAIIHDDNIQWNLYSIYDTLLPYFEVLKLPGCENCDHQTIGIKFEIFEELLIEN